MKKNIVWTPEVVKVRLLGHKRMIWKRWKMLQKEVRFCPKTGIIEGLFTIPSNQGIIPTWNVFHFGITINF
jgi:hypothetical protein